MMRLLLLWLVRLALAATYLYAGALKMRPGPVHPEFRDSAPALVAFEDAIAATGGLWQFVGVVQMLAGLLLLWPRANFIGALLLLPVATVVMVLHFCCGSGPRDLLMSSLYFLAIVFMLARERQKLRALWRPA